MLTFLHSAVSNCFLNDNTSVLSFAGYYRIQTKDDICHTGHLHSVFLVNITISAQHDSSAGFILGFLGLARPKVSFRFWDIYLSALLNTKQDTRKIQILTMTSVDVNSVHKLETCNYSRRTGQYLLSWAFLEGFNHRLRCWNAAGPNFLTLAFFLLVSPTTWTKNDCLSFSFRSLMILLLGCQSFSGHVPSQHHILLPVKNFIQSCSWVGLNRCRSLVCLLDLLKLVSMSHHLLGTFVVSSVASYREGS